MSRTVPGVRVGIVAAMMVVACTNTAAPSPTPTASAVPPTPTATPTLSLAAPTTTPAPTTTFLAFPEAPCCFGEHVRPGRYLMPAWFGIASRLDVPSGWRVLNERAARLLMLGRGGNALGNPLHVLLFADATGSGAPAEIIERVRSAAELTELSVPATVTVAGLPAIQLDMQARPNPDFRGLPADDIPAGVQYLPVIEAYFAPGFLWTTSSSEAVVRTIVLAVDDRVLLIYVEAPPADFDEFAVLSAAVLDSLSFGTE